MYKRIFILLFLGLYISIQICNANANTIKRNNSTKIDYEDLYASGISSMTHLMESYNTGLTVGDASSLAKYFTQYINDEGMKPASVNGNLMKWLGATWIFYTDGKCLQKGACYIKVTNKRKHVVNQIIPLYFNEKGYLTTDEYNNDSTDYIPYMNNVQSRIKSHWNPPKNNGSYHIKVYFTVDRNGNLLDAKITNSSGDSIADDAALKAIYNAAPFSPLPSTCKDSKVGIEFSFDYNLINNNYEFRER